MDVPEQPKFEKDFIMLSEFSELVGPVPVCIIPDDKAAGTFNTNHFAVRIMSSDFQTASGKLVGPDTHVILSEKQDNAYAYVHYFSCNDINARGYLRQYCFSYVTTSPSKIFDNFEFLLKRFGQVTSLLKAANHRVFQKDMSHYMDDLEYTRGVLQKEGLSESSEVDYSKLYSDYDFTKENVPERDVSQVIKNMDDTREILATLKEELDKEASKQVWDELYMLREKYREQRRKETGSDRGAALSDREGCLFPNGLSCMSPEPSANFRMSESFSSSESGYEPKQVYTHYVNKFERRLRSLEELAPKAHPIAMESIREIYKLFSRSEFVLAMEKEEEDLLDPCSTLLTVGRVPVVNFMQNPTTLYSDVDLPGTFPGSRCNSFCYPYHRLSTVSTSTSQLSGSLWITSKNTWGQPMQQSPSHLVLDDIEAKSGFKTDFMGDKLGLKQFPLYIDPVCYGTRLQRVHSIPNQLDEVDAVIDSDCLGPVDDPLPDSEQSGQFLSLPTGSLVSHQQQLAATAVEEDAVSRSSTAFATPEGLTPRSSDGELDQSEANSSVVVATARSRPKTRGEEEVEERSEAKTMGSHECTAEEAERTETDHDTDDDMMCLLPKINVNSQSSTEDRDKLKEEARSTDGSSSSSSCGRELLAPSPSEASDDSSSHFYSESQSTLTSSKEGVGLGGNSSREGSIKSRVNEGRSSHTDYSATNGTGREVDFSQNTSDPAAAPGIVRNGRGREGEAPAFMEAAVRPPPYSASHNTSELSCPPPPYARHQDATDLGKGRRGEGQRPDRSLRVTSINGSMEYPPVTSSDNQRTVVEFLPYGSSSSSSGGYMSSNSSSAVRGRHLALQGEEPEENYSTGSGLSNGGSAPAADGGGVALGRGVSASVLHGALSRAQVGPPVDSSHPSTGDGRWRKRENVVGAQSESEERRLLSPTFLVVGQSEAQGDNKGKKGFWGRRGSRPRPLFGVTYRKDKVVPDVFYSPTSGSLPSQTNLGGAASPGAASLKSSGSYPYSIYPSITSGMTSVTSMATDCPDSVAYHGPSVVKVIGKTNLPLASTLDHIESSMPFKPGKGILNFCRDTPVIKDLVYCLLHGRPLVLLGKQTEENLIRRLIRVLWLFVPGHSSQRQVITWQETPLDIRDLSRVRLIGLNKATAPLETHIKRYVSYWDCTTGKLFTPTYNGDLLSPITTRTKDKKNEEVFLAHIHSVLMDIAMKAFVYYHGYPVHVSNCRRSCSSQEFSSKKFLTVQDRCPNWSKTRYLHQQFGIKGGDADIIEYFVDVIREQLSVKLGISQLNGSPLDDGPVRLHLHVKACSESFCSKPKKPY